MSFQFAFARYMRQLGFNDETLGEIDQFLCGHRQLTDGLRHWLANRGEVQVVEAFHARSESTLSFKLHEQGGEVVLDLEAIIRSQSRFMSVYHPTAGYEVVLADGAVLGNYRDVLIREFEDMPMPWIYDEEFTVGGGIMEEKYSTFRGVEDSVSCIAKAIYEDVVPLMLRLEDHDICVNFYVPTLISELVQR